MMRGVVVALKRARGRVGRAYFVLWLHHLTLNPDRNLVSEGDFLTFSFLSFHGLDLLFRGPYPKRIFQKAHSSRFLSYILKKIDIENPIEINGEHILDT